MSQTTELAFGHQRQLDLRLRASPYRLRFENLPGQAFFRIDRAGGARTLHINTAHRFYEDIYDGPSATQEVRTALEILLFSFGDVLLGESEERGAIQVEIWSRRLELALGMMAQHLTESDDIDVGPYSWIDAV